MRNPTINQKASALIDVAPFCASLIRLTRSLATLRFLTINVGILELSFFARGLFDLRYDSVLLGLRVFPNPGYLPRDLYIRLIGPDLELIAAHLLRDDRLSEGANDS